MTIKFTQLADIKHDVYRNITGKTTLDEFDDLTSNAKAKAYAHKLTNHSIHYHAIDYIFQLSEWNGTRFGNGKYPVWYGSLDLQTSFHETLDHWYRTFILAPNFTNYNNKASRTVFKVFCQAALIDLRSQCDEMSELIDPNIKSYAITQPIGERVHQEGYPGLITKSAYQSGDNIAVFNKKILSDAEEYGNYIYEFDHEKSLMRVKNQKTNRLELSISAP